MGIDEDRALADYRDVADGGGPDFGGPGGFDDGDSPSGSGDDDGSDEFEQPSGSPQSLTLDSGFSAPGKNISGMLGQLSNLFGGRPETRPDPIEFDQAD